MHRHRASPASQFRQTGDAYTVGGATTLKEQIERLQADLARSDAEAGSYADQINLAIANRLEGFDRDKFGKRIRR
jgi:hypothetical protein